MVKPRRNWITEFTESELRSALAIVGTPESAASVAAELYGMSPDEQAYFEWVDTTLLLLSCASEALARQVLDVFGRTPEARVRLETEQKQFCESLIRRPEQERTPLEVSDVVHDTRGDCAVVAGLRAESGGRAENYITLFSQSEVRAALALVNEPSAAETIAADLFALSPEQQATLDWTDVSLWLLSAVSTDIADRVAQAFGTTPERLNHIHEMQELFRQLIHNGSLPRRDGLEFDDVVCSR